MYTAAWSDQDQLMLFYLICIFLAQGDALLLALTNERSDVL